MKNYGQNQPQKLKTEIYIYLNNDTIQTDKLNVHYVLVMSS